MPLRKEINMSLVEATKDIMVAKMRNDPYFSIDHILRDIKIIHRGLMALSKQEAGEEPEEVEEKPAVKFSKPKKEIEKAATMTRKELIPKRKKAERRVECRICGEKFVSVTHFHTLTHGMTKKEYDKKYPV